jgi:hypothetical protein
MYVAAGYFHIASNRSSAPVCGEVDEITAVNVSKQGQLVIPRKEDEIFTEFPCLITEIVKDARRVRSSIHIIAEENNSSPKSSDVREQ